MLVGANSSYSGFVQIAKQQPYEEPVLGGQIALIMLMKADKVVLYVLDAERTGCLYETGIFSAIP